MGDGSEIEHLRREVERLNGALERFSSGISHDLRNPMSAAAMACEVVMARSEGLSDDAKRAVGIVERQLRRAAIIVDGLLTMARSSRSPQHAPVDLKAIVENAARDLELPIAIDTMPAAIEGDEAAIAFAVKQLLRNAALHAPGTTVEVTCIDTGNVWELVIADDGPGVAPQDAERIFEPMERSEGSDGAGLGLTIVAAIAEAHGGRAWVEQRAGGGAAFHLTIAQT